MVAGPVVLDTSGLRLGADAYQELCTSLTRARSWPDQRGILGALMIQAEANKTEIARVMIEGEYLADEGGPDGGMPR